MARRASYIAAGRQRFGDAPVRLFVAPRRLAAAPFPAVFLQERVQPPDVSLRGVHRLEQPVQPGQARQAPHRPGLPANLVEQVRRQPIELPRIEHQVALLLAEIEPQPGLDPVLDHLAEQPRRAGPRPVRGVAVNPQRHRPSGRLFRHRGQFAPRQPLVEEVADLADRESQIPGRQRLRATAEHRCGDVQARRQRPARQRQVKPGRAASYQEVQQRHGAGVGEPLQFVQRQHARPAVRLDRAHHECGAVLHHLYVRVLAPQLTQHVQARLLEGQRQVVVQHPRLLVLQGQPRHGNTVLSQRPGAFRQQCRLAEAPAGE